MTYFSGPAVASNYAESRPYFHPLVIDSIRTTLGLDHVGRALDAACGTGQSALALSDLAETVIGGDISRDMLSAADRHPRIRYVAARAEEQPFAAASFQLVTVALAFHWFDRERFLAEARRVLEPGGWLVIYNNFFRAVMHGNPDFEAWARQRYFARYPSPPRQRQPLTDEDAAAAGFSFLERQEFNNDVVFSQEELTRYLMSQSNMIAPLEAGRETPDEARDWLQYELAPLFYAERETFLFGSTVWYLQRA